MKDGNTFIDCMAMSCEDVEVEGFGALTISDGDARPARSALSVLQRARHHVFFEPLLSPLLIPERPPDYEAYLLITEVIRKNSGTLEICWPGEA